MKETARAYVRPDVQISEPRPNASERADGRFIDGLSDGNASREANATRS